MFQGLPSDNHARTGRQTRAAAVPGALTLGQGERWLDATRGQCPQTSPGWASGRSRRSEPVRLAAPTRRRQLAGSQRLETVTKASAEAGSTGAPRLPDPPSARLCRPAQPAGQPILNAPGRGCGTMAAPSSPTSPFPRSPPRLPACLSRRAGEGGKAARGLCQVCPEPSESGTVGRSGFGESRAGLRLRGE